MGPDSTSPIVRLKDLAADGKQINVPLVTQLSGAGVGAGQLVGNEEMIDNYGMRVWLNPSEMKSRSITVTDVNNAIRAQNLNIASGTLGDLPAPGTPEIPIRMALPVLGNNAFSTCCARSW